MNQVPSPATTRDAGIHGGRPPALGRGTPASKPRRHGLRWLLGGIALVVFSGLAAWGIIGRSETISTLKVTADDASLLKVTLVSPQKGPTTRMLTLPGETYAWFKAPIYAQVTGYVEKWYKDYGAIVQKGDLLATIATPDLDQELQQARAQLEVAKTRASLAKVTAQRWQKLAGTQAVSQEAVDVNVADAKAQEAEVSAATFNVDRYVAQEAFKRVTAPFDGVVTARYTDIGNFVNAAGGDAGRQGRTQELFSVSDIHELRVFVSVPQDYSSYIKPGLSVSLTLPQFPNQTFKANFLTTAKSYETNARTIVTELTLPNPRQDIFPGAFVQVRFEVPTDPGILIVPEQSLLFRANGLQVALVTPDDKVHLQNITLGLNLGQTVQVTQGLKLTDRLIANPSDGLLENQAVEVVHAPPQNSNNDTPGSQPSPEHSGP
jgi:membrane fusion protein (multidrug efflux system)